MKRIILLLILLFAVSPYVLAQDGGNLMELVPKFQKLMKEAKDNGRDTTKALELDKKSRAAMESGNREEALNFLKEAIATLEGSGQSDSSSHQDKRDMPQPPANKGQSGAVNKKGGGIMDLLAEYQTLLKEAQSGGRDTTQAVSLNEQSMKAAKSGNRDDAERFLKEAVASLKDKNGKKHDEVVTASSVTALSQARVLRDSPFGMHEARFGNPDEVEAIKDLGASSARLAPQGSFIWDLIEKERGRYDWSASDKAISAGYAAGIKMLVNVMPSNRLDRPEVGPGKDGLKPPKDMDWYLEFLRRAAERYDGDGIDDAPGSPKIDAIQIGNEIDIPIFWQDTPESYALLLKRSYQTIKKAAPDIKVAAAGLSSPAGLDRFFKPMLRELNILKDKPTDRYLDIFDFHWSGQFEGENDYASINLRDGNYELKTLVASIKKELKKIGYGDTAVYITETSDYSDMPASMGQLSFPRHTERYHAASVVKRFVYPLASGVNKVYWAQIIEQYHFGGQTNGYFDNVALINNPKNPDGFSHKKLAYYTYKKMVEALDGSDWKNIQTKHETNGVFLYEFIKNGRPVWVAWNDNEGEKTLTIPAVKVAVTQLVPRSDIGKAVEGYSGAFESQTISAPAGSNGVVIRLGDTPVFIEER